MLVERPFEDDGAGRTAAAAHGADERAQFRGVGAAGAIALEKLVLTQVLATLLRTYANHRSRNPVKKKTTSKQKIPATSANAGNPQGLVFKCVAKKGCK